MKTFLPLAVILLFIFPQVSKSQIFINEIMATNASFNYEEDYYNFPDWLELYNNSGASVSLSGYFLSDDKENLKMWALPSGSISNNGFYVVFCDKENSGKHSNFGLSADGEKVYLSKSDGSIIDSVKYGKQFPNISFGRNSESLNTWAYCSTPTPGSSNMVTKATKQSSTPKFLKEAGRLSSSSSIEITGIDVRYSTNGSEPKANSKKYTTPVSVTKTTVVKAINTEVNKLTSEPRANTYFVNEHEFTIPVISLSFNPEYFYDDIIGIYVKGSNGTEGLCGSVANYHQNWERAAFFEYFSPEGTKLVSQPVGVKVGGGCTRGREQKSLSIYARSKYGNNDLDYRFFIQKPEINSYKSLLLRNSGNDQDQTLLRDAILQALVNMTMDIDYQSYKPASVYLNGDYFGIMNLREKVDEDYFYTNYNLKSDEVDFLEKNGEIIRGSNTEYNDIISYVSSNDMANDDNYKQVVNQIDIQEFINYMVFQIYIANRDWPDNNIKYWKPKQNGKWRWIVFDTDYGFGFRIDSNPEAHETFDKATGIDDGEDITSLSVLFKNLLNNEGFKKQFIATMNTHIHSSFSPQWVNQVIDSLSAIIDTEIVYNQNEYGRTKSQWQGYLNLMKEYALARQNFMPGYIKSYFNINEETVNISISNNYPQQGKVVVNNTTLVSYPFNMETYADLALSVKAKPEKGYKFKHWKSAGKSEKIKIISSNEEWNYLDEETTYPLNWNTTGYVDTAWENGNSEFGYGDGDETTVISYGSDQNNKIPTALFRKIFQITDTVGGTNYIMGLNADDGAIVYLNGNEVYRSNMDAGIVNFSDYAAGTINNENTMLYFSIDKENLILGENVIACEVHQATATSSDLSFNLTLGYTKVTKGSGEVYSSAIEINSDSSFNLSIEPVFEDIVPSPQGIYINEIAAVSGNFRDDFDEKSGYIELINSSSEDIEMYGFYLSDSKSNLMKYAISEGTVIKAGGFLVFYVDGESKQSNLHTPFILDTNGERVMLSQKVGEEVTVMDSAKFSYLAKNYSYGRYVDATGDWMHMVNPTPGTFNDSEELIMGTERILLSNYLNVYPNPNKGILNIRIDVALSLESQYYIDIIDMSGKQIMPRVLLNNAINTINISDFNQGIYFVRIIKDLYHIDTRKIIMLNR